MPDINFDDFKSEIENDLEYYIQYGTKHMNEISRYERTIADNNDTVQRGSPSYGQLLDSKPSIEGRLASHDAEIILQAGQEIMTSYCLKYLYLIKEIFIYNIIIIINMSILEMGLRMELALDIYQ